MTIQEVEERTGLTRSNIRYYEKEGLFSPKRDKENGYRNYSEGDVETIRRIAFLRTLGISVEEIRKIIAGKLSLCQTVERQSRKLQDDLKAVQDAALACERLLKDAPASFSELDVEQYTAGREGLLGQQPLGVPVRFRGAAACLKQPQDLENPLFPKPCHQPCFISRPSFRDSHTVEPRRGRLDGSQGGDFRISGCHDRVADDPDPMAVYYPGKPDLQKPYFRVCGNGLCFAGVTVEIFTILYAHGILKMGVFPLIAADTIILLALAVLGIWELDHMPER